MKAERDFRSLSPTIQAELRRRAVKAVESGRTQQEAAEWVGVHRQTVCEWVAWQRRKGDAALDGKRRGRNAGDGRRLTSAQGQKVQRWITDKCPDQLKLPFALWTRQAVRELIKRKFGLALPLNTVSDYLRRWGFTAQRPAKRAYEQQPERIQKWLDVEYPAIARRAKAERAEIHWGDEAGLRSDCQYAGSFAPKGKTPVADYSGKRFSTSMISTVTNRGAMRFMVYSGGLKADIFIVFLRRLIKGAKRKTFLILDNPRVHHAKKTRQWVEKNKDKIELFFLPPHAPQYNPDEFLNNAVKQNVNKRRIPKNKAELDQNLRSYLRSMQKKTDSVKNLFKAETVKYAAA
ncbi:hypothetical protein UZ36_05200 [Candidatus Nitromaritima sp. SCGC AAA799-C22]|nr:hypothetical protein UZ36_05200 [Candidatus Nitromaritima sp. SCGC AAA799-C22]